ncbi:MAG: hypothetical protein RIG84_13350 [Roseovarius sp.]
MSTASTNTYHTERSSRGTLSRALASLAKRFEAYAEMKSRRGQIEALNAKTDEDLARMGLRREEIPQYVFRDYFYI